MPGVFVKSRPFPPTEARTRPVRLLSDWINAVYLTLPDTIDTWETRTYPVFPAAITL